MLALLTSSLAAVAAAVATPAGPAPARTVMVIGAHADDLAPLARATLARYAGQGYRAVDVVLTTHAAGPAPKPGVLQPEPLEAIQVAAEAVRAAAVSAGATPVLLDLHPTRIRQGRSFVFTGSPS